MAVSVLTKLKHHKCLQILSFHCHFHGTAISISQSSSPTLVALATPKDNREIYNVYAVKNSLCNANFASLLKSCTDIEDLKQVHARILASGLNQNLLLATKLVNMYGLQGSMENAGQVFDKMPERDVFLWNVMIRGYAMNGFCEKALILHYQMHQTSIQPDKFTFTFGLKACAGLLALQLGKQIHSHIIKSGFDMDVFVCNALIDMYAKCGYLEIARQVFDKMSKRDLVSWNAMIVGYAQNGRGDDALRLFDQMQSGGVSPDSITMASALQACAHLGSVEQGKRIHNYIIQRGTESHVSVGNSLVAMYAKCGCLEVARELFEKMGGKDVVSWNAMISGYAQNGRASEALSLFHRMLHVRVTPSCSTWVSVLQACAHSAALQEGKCVHASVMRRGVLEIVVMTALIDMYAKSGSIENARRVFDKMSERNVVSWNAMIAGYGMHGQGKDAVLLFCNMQESCMEPNDVTFLCVLSACSHAGMVHEGCQYFGSMISDYCITPRIEHYVCMVDLLGRAGHLEEAHDFIVKMSLQPDARVWGALLAACRIHCNITLGGRVAEHLLSFEPDDSGYYVLLSNMYAAACRWDDVEKVRALMRQRRVRKAPGWSLT